MGAFATVKYHYPHVDLLIALNCELRISAGFRIKVGVFVR